jgi:hypothetical protein
VATGDASCAHTGDEPAINATASTPINPTRTDRPAATAGRGPQDPAQRTGTTRINNSTRRK